MPIYNWKCNKCKKEFSDLAPLDKDYVEPCPKCKSTKSVEKMLSKPNLLGSINMPNG